MATEKESLVVASKVKAYIKEKEMMTSADAIEALNNAIYELLDKAAERCQSNRRSTLKGQDI